MGRSCQTTTSTPQNQTKMESTTKIMESITSKASFFLLSFAIMSFLILIVFKADYYHAAFQVKFMDAVAWTMGCIIAFFIEGVRFSLMLSSAEDARLKRWFSFTIGTIASLSLLGYELYLCQKVGTYWSVTDTVYINILRFVAVMGMVLELRLCLLMKQHQPEQKADPEQKTEEVERVRTFHMPKDFFQNSSRMNMNQNGAVNNATKI